MAKIHKGRYTATLDGEFVVFVIGMRFNKLWKVHQWLPVFFAMPKMIATLMQHPEKGMLGARTMWSGKTITMIQYWRSFEQLEQFSRNPDEPHLGPWRRYNQRVAKSGDVGVFHETYKIGPGQYESVFANMPPIGLAKVGSFQPIGPRTEAARDRVAAATD